MYASRLPTATGTIRLRSPHTSEAPRTTPAAAPPPHALSQASPEDKERRAGFSFLEDVLAVVVVALVDDAGETSEVPATEVFEEGHLFEEVHQAAALLGHRRFRRRSEQRPCWS